MPETLIFDWRDKAGFESLAGLDQAELDWIFACRHPKARDVSHPATTVRMIRPDCPVRLFRFASPETGAAARGLRFRGGDNARRRCTDRLLERRGRSGGLDGQKRAHRRAR